MNNLYNDKQIAAMMGGFSLRILKSLADSNGIEVEGNKKENFIQGIIKKGLGEDLKKKIIDIYQVLKEEDTPISTFILYMKDKEGTFSKLIDAFKTFNERSLKDENPEKYGHFDYDDVNTQKDRLTVSYSYETYNKVLDIDDTENPVKIQKDIHTMDIEVRKLKRFEGSDDEMKFMINIKGKWGDFKYFLKKFGDDYY